VPQEAEHRRNRQYNATATKIDLDDAALRRDRTPVKTAGTLDPAL
jgi:hypothetical protein